MQDLHRALKQRLARKIGDVLLRQRKYEVYKRGGPATTTGQSTVWTGLPLDPGEKIELAALVARFPFKNTESQLVLCPSCSDAIPIVSGADPVRQPNEPRRDKW